MKKKILLILFLTICIIDTFAQKEEEIVAAVGVVAGVLATVAAYDAFIEKLENEATEWVLNERKEVKRFQLKLMNIRGEKFSNLSEISSCTFIVKLENGEEFVMMWIVSYGWWNDYGVEFSKIKVEIFDRKRWDGIILAMIEAGTNFPKLNLDSIPIYTTFLNKQQAEHNWDGVLKKNPTLAKSSFPKVEQLAGIETYRTLQGVVSLSTLSSVSGSKFIFPNPTNPSFPYELKFDKLDGDSYSVSDFENLRVVYNEKSLNIYFEELRSLVKFRSWVFNDITKELLNLN